MPGSSPRSGRDAAVTTVMRISIMSTDTGDSEGFPGWCRVRHEAHQRRNRRSTPRSVSTRNGRRTRTNGAGPSGRPRTCGYRQGPEVVVRSDREAHPSGPVSVQLTTRHRRWAPLIPENPAGRGWSRGAGPPSAGTTTGPTNTGPVAAGGDLITQRSQDQIPPPLPRSSRSEARYRQVPGLRRSWGDHREPDLQPSP